MPRGDLRSCAVHSEVQEPRGGVRESKQQQLRPSRRRLHQRHREGNIPISRAQSRHGVVSELQMNQYSNPNPVIPI